MSEIHEIPEALKDLTNAITTQVRVSNRYWLVLFVASTFVAFPGEVTNGMIKLPFSLGKIPLEKFNIVGLLLVSVLMISFCSAHAQVLRVSSFIHRMLEEDIFGEMIGGHDVRDFFDALRVPSITRVAPLPQLAFGRNQFFIDKAKIHKGIKFATGLYYFFLKFLSITVYFGFPAFALLIAVNRYHPVNGNPCLAFLVWLFVIGAALTLIQLLIYEIKYIWKVLIIISRKE